MSSFTSKLAILGIEPMSGQAFEPFSEENIARLQKKVSAPLPEVYKQFLMTYGRSMFSAEINCRPHEGPLYFGWFYGFSELMDAVETCLISGTLAARAEAGAGCRPNGGFG